MPRTKEPADPDDAPLKRLGGGRWQTRDARFTIEPQSGTWVVVDAEQTDDLGLPLVRGPFPSLSVAKAAISTARTSAPLTSPLAGRMDGRRAAPTTESGPTARHGRTAERASKKNADKDSSAPAAERPRRSLKAEREAPAEPGWMATLGSSERGRARRLIAHLAERGASDPEGIVRRDLVGDVPAIAAQAIEQRLAALGDDASPEDVAALLGDGRDEDLGVRWRLVDGDDRPIVLRLPARRRRT